MKPTSRNRTRRLLRAGALVVLFACALAIGALPWLLALPFAQRQLAAAANRILAPSRVRFSSLSLSWTRSTTINGLVLQGAGGQRLLVSQRAVFNWSLSQILFAQPIDARLSIEHGELGIERFADGSVDLYETLKPVISEHPQKRLVIRIPDGSLRFRDPAFSEPVVAETADMTINLGRLYEPIVWDIHLARSTQPAPGGRLDLKGAYSRAEVDARGDHDLELSLAAKEWPWTLENSMIEARGELSGTIEGQRRMGRISLSADAIVNDLLAVGPILAADTLHLDQAQARLKIDGDGTAWTVDHLEFSSPLGELRAEGSVPPTPDRGAWLQGNLNLAAVARQLPQTLHLRDELRVERGSAGLRADLQSDKAGESYVCNVTGKVTDLIAHQGQKTLKLPDPAALVATIKKTASSTTLERFKVETPFLTADGQGDLDSGISVTAALDLAVFRERFRDWIDLGSVVLAGKGKLSASYQRQGQAYAAKTAVELRDLRLDGLPMASRINRDLVTLAASASGTAATSGWPSDWQNLTLEASSDHAQCKIKAANDSAAGKVGMTAVAHADLSYRKRHDRLDCELIGSWQKGSWSAERIGLVLVPMPAGNAAPEEARAVRWRGRGRYDPASDELIVESDPGLPAAAAQPGTWIAGEQRIKVVGVRSWPAKDIEASTKMDLASLGFLLAPGDQAWSGQLDALIRARPEHDKWSLGLRVDLHNPGQIKKGSQRYKIDGDVTLGLKASYAPSNDSLELTEMGLKAPYVALDGAGVIRQFSEDPELDLRGVLGIDWPGVQEQLAIRVEPGARITGRPRPWRLSGKIPANAAIDRLGSLDGEVAVQIDSLDIFGMRLSETPIVLRTLEGRLVVRPIDSKLNGGILHADPEIVQMKDGSTWLEFSSETRLEGAVINDEVSHRVLSFVAPVLDGATRVQGRVSFDLADAAFPLAGAAEDLTSARGKLLFDDVRFMPGQLADQLLSVFRLESKPLVELRDPVSVRIAGRKVYQNGLLIPVGNVASVALDGSVDFDRNLDMVARFSLNPLRSRVPVLSPLVETARFELPIRGTLAKPKIDGEALKERWKSFGSLLQGSMEAGMNGLQQLFQGLPLPRAKAVTPEERRRLKDDRRKDRLEKKAARAKRPSLTE